MNLHLGVEGFAEEQSLPTEEAESCECFLPLPELSWLPRGCPFHCPSPSPIQSPLAWALLASRTTRPAWDSVPQSLTFWVEAPLVNQHPVQVLGLWFGFSLAPLNPGQSAGPFPHPRPALSPPRLGSALCFALRLSFSRAQSWPPVSLAWPTSKPDPDSRSWVPTGRGSHRFKKLWTAKSQTICTLFFRSRRYLCVRLCARC